jgi:drug/metabolite transporter (DMT)-like permease
MKNLSASSKGILLITLGSGLLTLNDGMAKWLTASYPVGQVIAVRGGITVCLILAVVWFRGPPGTLRVTAWKPQTLRGALMAVSTFSFITGLSMMPIADMIAIAFAGPIITAALAIPLLGERLGWRRWSAIFVGFLGVIIMVRPTPGAFQIAALLPLLSAFMGSLRDIITRRMPTSESTVAILLYSTAMVALFGAGSVFFVDWQPIQSAHLALFAISGILVGGAHVMVIMAFRLAEVGLISPFKYSSMIWAVLVGYLVWGNLPDEYVIAGSCLVVASGLYILHRERIKSKANAAEAGDP